ncbi:aspartyl aminopeptidase [Mycena sp. CBHHK59/15]|nr:aspartyl aminopeptidase [Mycena sp. CBHHK59/15]
MLPYPSAPEAANRFLSFVNASPTPFHAVHNAVLRLEKAGFQKVLEKDAWEDRVQPGGKYYFCRNQSSLVAFTLPQKWKQGAGVSIVGTHVDSPNLKVGPISRRSKEGYLQVGVETYGGGIWTSWLDRDLSLAGRVVTAHVDGFKSKLLKIDRPILRIPNLAIHLERNGGASRQNQLGNRIVPILGQIASQFNKQHPGQSSPALLSLLASELSVRWRKFTTLRCTFYLSLAPLPHKNMDRSLYDTQPPRMDNLFCAVEALAQSVSTPDFLTLEGNEIGSISTSGAESSLLPSLINRLSPTPSTHAQSISKSFLVSADMGHAVHPNYTAKHEENHKPVMNGGVVIKTNAKQRYASDAISTFMVKQLIERKGGKVQEYEVRNDMACGSTVGPMLSKMGVRTCDHAIDLFRSLFESYAELDNSLTAIEVA